MRSRTFAQSSDKGNYDLSISALMSALCCIFLLFLAINISKTNQQRQKLEKNNAIVSLFNKKIEDLAAYINNEFSNNFQEWNADEVIIGDSIRLRFFNDSFMFDEGTAIIKDEFKNVLSDFFSRLINIVCVDEFINDIDEIRIECCTSNISESEEAYTSGLDLSMERTKNILIYCLEHSDLTNKRVGDKEITQWIKERVLPIGYTSSIISEDSNKSNYIDFTIHFNTESVINELQKSVNY